ncbi:hypothetical protein RIF23_10640 [Lipingzhangella sp. LS1_29]|uniref:DUF6879 domain-containing protein n=1 Tax=Lipingzhangella rawalii TaxID=2055835 RepID=A0ABU2H632_9ACTN|nr:DUF6879 family protein [Lipingzhangella rawalii]MDS1270757.1 hypothetical protein [Lipingzhangella rawalii]
MLNCVSTSSGKLLAWADYLADFRREFERGGDVFAKFERRQTFREPGDASWEAFAAGDWQTALERNEEDRPEAEAMVARYTHYGYQPQRIRVVEFPISPYLQWEMQFFRLLAEAGQDLRVVRAEQVADLEQVAPLPEVVLLGDRVLYEVNYDATGTVTGGRRIEDPEVIAGCRTQLAELFEQGEPLPTFFEKHVAPLPPPAV